MYLCLDGLKSANGPRGIALLWDIGTFLCISFLFLYYFFTFFDSFRIVPIRLSERVSRSSVFRIVPAGSPYFFSKVPTVQSLLVFLVKVFSSYHLYAFVILNCPNPAVYPLKPYSLIEKIDAK